MAKKTTKNTKLAFFFWIIFVIIIVIAFLIARERISNVLEETGFLEEISGNKKEQIVDILQPQKPETVIELVQPGTKAESGDSQTTDPAKPTTGEKPVETITPLITQPTDQKEENLQLSQTEAKPEKTDKKPTTTTPKKETTDLVLYFVTIDKDGTIVRREMTRTVDKTNTPLTASLKALLAGPTLAEMQKDTITLIPEGTKLLSASITDKVAYLSFSDEFNFNTYGVEGYIGQLMQIVYTATAFSTIDSVQFLINGQKQDYLGAEGVWIGTPLPRSSFK